MNAMRPRMELLVIGGAGLLAGVPLVFGTYWTNLLTQALIFGGVALGLDILVGRTGMPSLGHGAFFGLAGYGVALGTTRWDWNPWLAAAFGIGAATAVAAAFAPLAVRLRGLAFLTVMLAFGQVWWGLATRGGTFTGGENGLPGIRRPSLGIASWNLATPDGFFLFTLIVTALVTLSLARLAASPVGLSFQGVRDNDRRMTALGYNVAARRVVAFVVAASAGAVYGVLSAFFNGFVGPGSVDWRLSAQLLLSVVLGGAGSLWGPFVAGGTLHIVKTYLTGETQRWPMVLGALYVIAVLVLPGGLASLGSVLRRARHRPRRRVAVESPS
ncbi:MAG: branched-chain amino acid ABC transporter permease [Thermomicrobiales bacterium]|nr:MAG: branched-chain amino acid ABC transporter permease [Thermomicrobiales bacterium]